jgi:hypothetical protein
VSGHLEGQGLHERDLVLGAKSSVRWFVGALGLTVGRAGGGTVRV